MFKSRAILSILILLFLTACGGLQGVGLDAQILSFTANPSNIKAGEGATLAWTIIGGAEDTTVTLNPGDVDLSASGNYQVTPEETTTYTLSVKSEGTTATKTLTINVEPRTPIDPTPPENPPTENEPDVACGDGADLVPFEDANLQRAVEKALGLPNNGVSCYTVTLLENLAAQGTAEAPITDLSGLEFAKNLKVVNLGKNIISDLTPLGAITTLEQVYLYQNDISDLTPLSTLTSLKTLELSYNDIGDIAPLLTLPWTASDDYVGLKAQSKKIPQNQLTALERLVSEVVYDEGDVGEEEDPTPNNPDTPENPEEPEEPGENPDNPEEPETPGDPEKYDLTFTTQKNTPIHFLVSEKYLGDSVTAETSQNGYANPVCSSPGAGCIFEFNVTYEPAQDFIGNEIITVTTFNGLNFSGNEVVNVWKIKIAVVEDFIGLNNIEVQNIEDGAAGSLRQALIDAEPGATVTFSESLEGKNLNLRARLKIYKDVTIVGNVEINSGVDIGKNAEVKLSGMSFSGQLGRGVRSSALINIGNLVLEDVQVSNIISDVCDKFVSNPYGSLESYGVTTLKGNTEIAENSRGVTVFDGGNLILEDSAKIYGNTGLNACGNILDGGGVYIAEGGSLIGADYDGLNDDDNVFDNQPDNVFFVAGDPNKGECGTKVVEFKSERLEQAIRTELELSSITILTCERMKTLTELDAQGSIDSVPVGAPEGVDNLTGLEYAINLTKLNLTGGSYQDLSPLANLTKLEYLRLDFTSFRDISVLLNLPWSGTDDYASLQYSAVCEPDIETLQQKVETVEYIFAGTPCEAQPGN